ncbi:MAG: hypothetical protein HPY55_15715 [Firmicutes bacterium]|nr:hypothetical protein [Bacillota bacterium]
MIRRTRAGMRRTLRRRTPPRHLARPGPGRVDLRRALGVALPAIVMVVLLINVAEIGIQELVYPHPVPGFIRLTPAGVARYRFVLAGHEHYIGVSRLLEAAGRLKLKLGVTRAGYPISPGME